MPLKEAALLGCAMPTGAGIVFNTIKLKKRESVAILGIGGIGSSALLASAVAGAEKIIAVDINDEKLDFAKSLGATHVINSKKINTLESIMEITNRKGVDFAIEAAGLEESMESAFASVRNNGGVCVIAGNLEHGKKIFIDPFDLIKGKRIIGTWGGESNIDVDVHKYVDWFMNGKLKLDLLISKEYALTEINHIFRDMQENRIVRGIIDLLS